MKFISLEEKLCKKLLNSGGFRKSYIVAKKSDFNWLWIVYNRKQKCPIAGWFSYDYEEVCNVCFKA